MQLKLCLFDFLITFCFFARTIGGILQELKIGNKLEWHMQLKNQTLIFSKTNIDEYLIS